MTSSTHKLRMVVTLVLALAVAMLTVPSALAAAGCPCNADLPQSVADTRPASASLPIVNVVQSGSFAWGDFGIGIAAAVGALLIVGGIGAAVRHTRRSHERLGTT